MLGERLDHPGTSKFGSSCALADNLTVEADSGGHTDNRPLVILLPTMLKLRDELQEARPYSTRVGVGGGLGTPEAVMERSQWGLLTW